MKHILNVLVQDRSGVLVRVAGLFSRRGYNINSLTVGNTENPGVSSMTIVVEGDDRIIEQVTKQLHKIVEVLKISDVTHDEYVGRELLMLRVVANKEDRLEIMNLCDIFRIKIVDIQRKSFIIEATGTKSKLSAIEDAFRPFGIQEIKRTGLIAMVRGENKAAKREQ
ncbi:MAG TPA: acetolactate synthase small subunit [Candidatus Avidehalobacter gallistercoris]|mgnify:CR=1 FL=1|uniref:Acetolactate synthase small subunit n=1 Tax=Candidatus Avidehalobacter gallistercoris TaxID=2840694 RepID=A0A9D1HKV2_9FIRM|nr:acetolactate synthase small subunit [Candidatus Avidehalobacter gallistercoris]